MEIATTKTIFEITRLKGNNFKKWAHSIVAAAVLNGNAKTGSQFLRNIYNELIEKDDLDPVAKIGLLYCGNKNKLDYLANYQPNNHFSFDFIMFKAEFVRLMIEKAGI